MGAFFDLGYLGSSLLLYCQEISVIQLSTKGGFDLQLHSRVISDDDVLRI